MNGQGTNDVLISWPNTTIMVNAWVIETNADGCIGDTTFAQVYVAEPSTSHIVGPTEACEGQYVELEAFDTRTDGKFLWSNGDTSQVISFVAKNDTTLYRVAFNQDCEHDTIYHHVKVYPTPKIAVATYAPFDTVSFNSTVTYEYNGSRAGLVEWFLNGSTIGTGTRMEVVFSQPGWNTVRIIASSGQCADTLEHRMFVEDNVKVFVPTAFSPNGDGNNDIWNFEGLGYDQYDVEVRDRWGQLIASWDETSLGGWDGTYRGTQVAAGAYSYYIRVMTIHNHIEEYTGPIVLIR